ncbi:MAG: hypothetical protein JWR01_816, partial [Subtercola sp.]|nr:hypothetical protein [Subtercola sp.]
RVRGRGFGVAGSVVAGSVTGAAAGAPAAAISGDTGDTVGPATPIEMPRITAAPTIVTVTVEVARFHTGPLMSDLFNCRRWRAGAGVVILQEHQAILRGFLGGGCSVLSVSSGHFQAIRPAPGSRHLDPKLGGGALLERP